MTEHVGASGVRDNKQAGRTSVGRLKRRRGGTGKPVSRVAGRLGITGATLATLICMAAPAASADYELGTYKVTDGKLKQSFKYNADSYSVDYGAAQCWEYHYHSVGSGSFNLEAAGKRKYKGRKGYVQPGFRNGIFELRGLGWSGDVTRETEISEVTRPGSGYNEECNSENPPNPPTQETFGCGADSVSGYVTPELLPFELIKGHGWFPIHDDSSGSGNRMGLFGEMPQPLGINPCPSESTFASLLAGGLGDTTVSRTKLDAFESLDKKIHLSGKTQYRGNKYFAYAGLEHGEGFQEASTTWSLELKCVKKTC